MRHYDLEDDPDYMRAMEEAERNHPWYPEKVALREIQTTLSWGIPALRSVGWLIACLLGLILWRVW